MPDASFLLVHGSCHGAWCWRDVLPFLGNRARALDLPAHGDDPTPAAQATLAGYAHAILDAAGPGPVILVAHSMAGFPVTLAAQMAPDRVAAVVYVCAYLPVAGLSLAQMRRAGPSQPLAGAIRVAPDRQTFSFDPALVSDRFYHDCPPETAAWTATRLCPEPIAPQETPIASTARAEGLPRFYIRCTADRAIPPDYQQTMAAGLPPDHVFPLPTGHSPFFAAPAALADLLTTIAGRLA